MNLIHSDWTITVIAFLLIFSTLALCLLTPNIYIYIYVVFVIFLILIFLFSALPCDQISYHSEEKDCDETVANQEDKELDKEDTDQDESVFCYRNRMKF